MSVVHQEIFYEIAFGKFILNISGGPPQSVDSYKIQYCKRCNHKTEAPGNLNYKLNRAGKGCPGFGKLRKKETDYQFILKVR